MGKTITWTSIDEVINKMRWEIEPWMYLIRWKNKEFYNRKCEESGEGYRKGIINDPADLFEDFKKRFKHLLHIYSLEIDASIDKKSWRIEIKLSKEEEEEKKVSDMNMKYFFIK